MVQKVWSEEECGVIQYNSQPKIKTKQQTRNRNKVLIYRDGKGRGRYWRDKKSNLPEVEERSFHRLGFASYSSYLNSSMWAIVREMVFEKKGRFCCVCNAPASQIHHTRYGMQELVGKALRHLHPICDACHNAVEFEDGKKVDIYVARAKFWRMFEAHSRTAAAKPNHENAEE